MRKELWTHILTTMTVLAVVACANPRQPIVSTAPHPPAPQTPGTSLGSTPAPATPVSPAPSTAPSATSPTQGTVDHGGGHSFDNKMLEQFAKTLRERDQIFETRVLPRLALLKQKIPLLGNQLQYIAETRKWYFVPHSLDKIPSERVGAAFPTDQDALQSLNEVWVDDLRYPTKDDKGKETLIVHELVMGLRLLKFTSNYDNCMAGETFDTRDSFCGTASTTPKGNLKLTPTDYEQIRNITLLLLSDFSKTDATTLRNQIFAQGFRYYYLNSDRIPRQIPKRTVAEIYRDLLTQKSMNSLPSYSGFNKAGDATSRCEIEFGLSADQKSLTVVRREFDMRSSQMARPEVKVTLADPTLNPDPRDPLSRDSGNFEDFDGRRLGSVELREVVKTPKIGDKKLSLVFVYDDNRIRALEFQTYAFSPASYSDWHEMDEFSSLNDIRNFDHICYNRDKYTGARGQKENLER